MQKIIPHLWYDDQAEGAADFYAAIFKNSRIGSVTRYDEAGAKVSGRPEGSAMTVAFEIEGQQFVALNGGPVFSFTPAVSFLVGCQSPEEVDGLWRRLVEGGTVLMELDKYPFSERYGWLQDRYGLSWQVMFMGGRATGQKITPTLMFVGDVCGKAEEAVNLYVAVFHNAAVGDILRYGKGEEPDKEGTMKHVTFMLEGQEFAAMDSAHQHKFTFTEAISFLVNCDTQAEIDHYWGKLSAVPEAEQCGWLKDKYGLSWQIVPAVLSEMLGDEDKRKVARVTDAFLKMKKFDIAGLRAAYEG